MDNRHRQLLSAGVLLFLLALFTGMIFPQLKNPRMGLSAHLVGLIGGVFLMAVGSIWKEIALSKRLAAIAFGSAIFGAYANLATTFLAATFATNRLTPLAGSGHAASPLQENIVTGGLVLASAAMVTCCILLLWGLQKRRTD
jgi:(hydroxyamino)benzene mutase